MAFEPKLVAARPKMGSNIVVVAEVELTHFSINLYLLSQYTVPQVACFILEQWVPLPVPSYPMKGKRLRYTWESGCVRIALKV